MNEKQIIWTNVYTCSRANGDSHEVAMKNATEAATEAGKLKTS